MTHRLVVFTIGGSDFGPNWAILAPKGTDPEYFHIRFEKVPDLSLWGDSDPLWAQSDTPDRTKSPVEDSRDSTETLFGPNVPRLTPNGSNVGLFKTFSLYILAHHRCGIL